MWKLYFAVQAFFKSILSYSALPNATFLNARVRTEGALDDGTLVGGWDTKTRQLQIRLIINITRKSAWVTSVGDSLRVGRSGNRIPTLAKFSAPLQTGPVGPHSLLYTGYRVSFPRAERPGRVANHTSHLAPRLKKSKVHLYSLLWTFTACSRANFTVTFTLYLNIRNCEKYLYWKK